MYLQLCISLRDPIDHHKIIKPSFLSCCSIRGTNLNLCSQGRSLCCRRTCFSKGLNSPTVTFNPGICESLSRKWAQKKIRASWDSSGYFKTLTVDSWTGPWTGLWTGCLTTITHSKCKIYCRVSIQVLSPGSYSTSQW